MVVCPSCREIDAEDRLACQRCGTSLEPGVVALPPRRSEAERRPLEATIDGTNALRWDVSVAAEGGERFLMREVVVVMNDVGWRITLNDLLDGFDASAVVFEDMLDSWQFA